MTASQHGHDSGPTSRHHQARVSFGSVLEEVTTREPSPAPLGETLVLALGYRVYADPGRPGRRRCLITARAQKFSIFFSWLPMTGPTRGFFSVGSSSVLKWSSKPACAFRNARCLFSSSLLLPRFSVLRTFFFFLMLGPGMSKFYSRPMTFFRSW